MKIKPLGDYVLLHNLETGDIKRKSGIIIADDSKMSAGERGIKNRWAQVFAVGPDQTDVKEGDWVLMEHGRWTEGQMFDPQDGTDPFKVWLADNNGMMAVSEEKPEEIIERGM